MELASARPGGAGILAPRYPRIVEEERTRKLETPVRLGFDSYPLDLADRAQAFQKLVAGGMAVNDALATSGPLADD